MLLVNSLLSLLPLLSFFLLTWRRIEGGACRWRGSWAAPAISHAVPHTCLLMETSRTRLDHQVSPEITRAGRAMAAAEERFGWSWGSWQMELRQGGEGLGMVVRVVVIY